MKLFSHLYTRMIQWSRHPRAIWFLAINSFVESVFWPIPPDVMLAPMCLAQPQRAWRYALVAAMADAASADEAAARAQAFLAPLRQALGASL